MINRILNFMANYLYIQGSLQNQTNNIEINIRLFSYWAPSINAYSGLVFYVYLQKEIICGRTVWFSLP